jgi:ATP-binding cassette subfamily F protein uup
LRGELTPTSGTIRRADWLRVVYFDQKRELDPRITLRRALAPEGDSVIYQDRVTHVASWAARFLFTGEQLNQPVGRLSGGERARVLIAQLMLQPADLLLLDEPTNDLDIPTLEILEESLLEFRGSLVLVTHDRYMLDRVSTVVLGLDGAGSAEVFADYRQWESWQSDREKSASAAAKESENGSEKKLEKGIERRSDKRSGNESQKSRSNGSQVPGTTAAVAPAKKKLAYLEAREYATMEQRVAEAEEILQSKRVQLEDPTIASDGPRLLTAHAELEAAQNTVDNLYARWAELEKKKD